MNKERYDGSKLIETAHNEKALNRLRRLVRKQFKEDTSHDATYSMRLLIVPLRFDGVRLKITVTRHEGGMGVSHVLSQWIYKKHLMFNVYESVTIAPAFNGKPESFDFDPKLSETREHAVKALHTLLGDPIAELRLAALSGRKKSVIGA